MTRLVSRLACHASETDSISVRSAIGPSEGRETDSKSVYEGSNPSGPATGSDAEGCCFALQAERLGALPSDSTRSESGRRIAVVARRSLCPCAQARISPWYGLTSGSSPDMGSMRVRCNRLHRWLPTSGTRIVPGHSHHAAKVLR